MNSLFTVGAQLAASVQMDTFTMVHGTVYANHNGYPLFSLLNPVLTSIFNLSNWCMTMILTKHQMMKRLKAYVVVLVVMVEMLVIVVLEMWEV